MEALQKEILNLQQENLFWKNVSNQLVSKLNELIRKFNEKEGNVVVSELNLESIQSNINPINTQGNPQQPNTPQNTTKELLSSVSSSSQPSNIDESDESISLSKKRKIIKDNDDKIPNPVFENVLEDQILILDTPVQATRKRLKKLSDSIKKEQPSPTVSAKNDNNATNNNNNNTFVLPVSKSQPSTQKKQLSKPKHEESVQGGYNTRLKRGTLPPAPKGRLRKKPQDYPSDSEDSSYSESNNNNKSSTESSSESSSASDSEDDESATEETTKKVSPVAARPSQGTKKATKKFSATSSKYYQSSEEEESESADNFIDDEDDEVNEPQAPRPPPKHGKLDPIDEDEIQDLLATQGNQPQQQIVDSDSENDEKFIVSDHEGVEYVETVSNQNNQQVETSPTKTISNKMDIEEMKKNIATQLEAKETPIHNAIAKSDLEQVSYLIKKHGCEILSTKDSVGSTPLMCAVESGNMKCLNCVLYCLINDDTNFDKILDNASPDIEELFTTFVDAAKMEKLREEIIDTCDHHGLNVFFYCCRSGRYQMFKHLFGVVTTPAAFESPSDVKSQVVEDLGEFRDSQGAYLLHHAAASREEHAENLVTQIIEYRINDINCMDNEQSTPLHWATGARSVDCLRVLILYGANVELNDIGGSTALHIAAANGFTDCVNILVHEGNAKANCRDRAGWPPLLYSDFQAHKETVLVLLEADPSTLAVLGNRSLLQDAKAKPVVMSVLKYIAEVPQFYGILNEFLRKNLDLLGGSFSFMLEKKGLLDLENKRLWLLSMMEKKMNHSYSSSIEVDRNDLVDDTLKKIMHGTFDPRAKNFKVTFRGEAGFGAGVRREFFQVISSALLKCERPKLFKNTNNQGYQPIYTQDRSKFLEYYKLTGIIIGMAIFNKELTSFQFTKPFLKQLMGRAVTYKDVQDIDQEYYNSLTWLLENDITDMELNFAVDEKDDDTCKLDNVNLIPNGKNITVTEKNKKQYVDLRAEWKLATSFHPKKEAVLDGLQQVFKLDWLTFFTENELQLLISGLHKVDVADWEQNTVYGGYQATDPQIVWFWTVVKKMNEEERALLLQFATGSSNVPVGGFRELQGMSGKQRFTISAVANDPPGRIMSASTCFNLLKIPRYGSFNEMEEKIHIAIRFGVEGFAFS